MQLNKLYPYQLENATHLAKLGFGADLSDVGTGKTVTAFGVMELLKANTILVICPKSVQSQWVNKFMEFMDFEENQIFYPKKPNKLARNEAFIAFDLSQSTRKVFIATYEQVKLMPLLHSVYWDVIYADEVHRLGSPLTLLYKEIMKLKTKARYGATATPLRSSPLQAFGIFNWLQPGCMGKNYYQFQARYVLKNEFGWTRGYRNLDELAFRIKPFYVKTTIEDAGIYMPELIEEDLIFSLSAKEQKLYDNIRREMLLGIEHIEINKIENPTNLYSSVVKLGKLQELCDASELLGESVDSTKIDTLKDSLQDTLASGSKAVIFTRFSRMANIIVRCLAEYNPARIVGDTKDRQAEIDKFRNDPTCRVIVGTTAMSEGIDGLQDVANLLYMVDVPLGSFGMLTQIKGRISRHGQRLPMTCFYLMAKKTVDIKLKQLLISKAVMSERVFGNIASVKEILQ